MCGISAAHLFKNNNMRLSPHFDLSEFTRSNTARLLKIDNVPNLQEIENLTNLCINVLEPARMITNAQVYITSGFRSPTLNHAVGGVPSSQHCKGLAADLRVYTQFYTDNLVSALKETDFDQLIFEKSGARKWIHVSWSPNPRHQIINQWNDDTRTNKTSSRQRASRRAAR